MLGSASGLMLSPITVSIIVSGSESRRYLSMYSGCSLPPGGDTGIPPVAGHYSFSPFPGYKINIQVNLLP